MAERRVLNLCFHGIGRPARALEPGEDRYWVSRGLYSFVLDAVMERPDVRISFDDGNASDVQVGLPELVSRQLSASFFVLAGRLNRPGSLTEADLATLTGHGMAVGSHGMDHVPWRGLDTGALERELVGARAVIAAAAGQSVTEAALPLGRYNRPVLSALRAAGYQRVYSSDRALARPTGWLQPRFSIRADDSPAFLERFVLGPQSVVGAARHGLVSSLKRRRRR